MEEYYFLFLLGLLWCIFATIQDLRKREIANWLNFSMIIFALAYRAFYSIELGDGGDFFLFGLGGFGIFLLLANLLYYGRAFAGGDAKLLMGFGALLPFESINDLLFISIGFILLLFFVGAIFSLVYSCYLVYFNQRKFRLVFVRDLKKYRKLLLSVLLLSLTFFIISIVEKFGLEFWLIFSVLLFLLALLYIYLKAVEESCLIVLVDSKALSEGDWLERDIKVEGKVIKKSVHGLSAEEIRLLRKYGKKVWIKQGAPFGPAFLISLLIIGAGYLFSIDLLSLFTR